MTNEEKIAQLESNLSATKTDLGVIATGVSGLNTTIQTLQSEIAAAGTPLSAAAQAALDQAVNDSSALKTQADGIAAGFAPSAPAPPASGTPPA